MTNKVKPTQERFHNMGSMECWCKPDVVFVWGQSMVVVHKGEGEELPPAKVIAQAIADLIANGNEDEDDG